MLIHIVAFDIGETNFAFSIKQIDVENRHLSKYIYLEVIDLTKSKKILPLALKEELDKRLQYLNMCDVFLIERQITQNLKAKKIFHYLQMYLYVKYEQRKIIQDYSSVFKTYGLNAPELDTKYKRKKWTVGYVSCLLNTNTYYMNLVKKDDIADTVCMIESYEKKNL